MYHYVLHQTDLNRAQVLAVFWLAIDAKACAARLSTTNHHLVAWDHPEYFKPGDLIKFPEA